jgi:hypothetical protein
MLQPNAPAMPEEQATERQGRRPGAIDLLFMLVVTLAALGYCLAGSDKEYIQRGDPELCGIYCRMAKDYGELLEARSFDRHYFQKSLQAAAAHLFLRPFNSPIPPRLANDTLELISALVLVACVFIWHLVARRLHLTALASWLGFAGICLGQTTLRVVPAAQESPDTIALFMGMLALHSHLSSRRGLLFACFALSGMVQVQLQLVLLPLVLLAPGLPGGTEGQGSLPAPCQLSRIPGMRAALDAATAIGRSEKSTFLLFFLAYIATFTACAFLLPRIRPPFHGVANEISILLPASILLASAAMAMALETLSISRLLREAGSILCSITFGRLAGVVAILAFQSLLTSHFARGEPMSQAGSLLGSLWLVYSFHYQSIEQPLKAIVAHVAYFGPVAALIVVRWRHIGTFAWAGGDRRLVLVVAAMVVLMVNSESRHHVAFLPWLAAMALAGLAPVTRTFALAFLAASAIASRVYADYLSARPDHDPFLFTWGPWFTKQLYAANLGVALFLLAVTLLMLRQPARAG